PPESSPLIYGEVTEYGDNLTVRCSSAKSKPAANLSWYVNDVLDEIYNGIYEAGILSVDLDISGNTVVPFLSVSKFITGRFPFSNQSKECRMVYCVQQRKYSSTQ
ncbi:hypothetical protein CEXT_503601, partial [Caerostris extrusa]